MSGFYSCHGFKVLFLPIASDFDSYHGCQVFIIDIAMGIKFYSFSCIGGEDHRAARDLVLRAPVHGREGLPDLAQAQQKG